MPEEIVVNITEEQVMGTKEAAEIWHVSRDTVRRWCNKQWIRATQDAKGCPWHIIKTEKPVFIK